MAESKLEIVNKTEREESVILDGNGILRCYNMFPTQFGSIEEMIDYLPQLQAMGFNAVWINPVQTAGDVQGLFKRDKTIGVRAYNEVTRSLYAMTDCDLISPYFNPLPPNVDPKLKKQLDMDVMQKFTSEARNNGLVPMFDLVLNHVAADSRHRKEHPEWFQKDVHPDFKDAIAFDYSDPQIRDEIIEQFWKPYIYKYMIDYGFEGVRIDAVGYLNPELRKQIYAYIYDLAEQFNKPKPVILDELLFSGSQKLTDVVDGLLLPEKGPTHITRGTYYAQRDSYGGLPGWCKEEEGVKAQVVFLDKQKKLHPHAKGGCIAFSGNHDHNSLAMTILEEMAEHRLANHHTLHGAQEKFKHERSYDYDEALESVLRYSFVKDIQNEILNGNESTIKEVETRMREKIAFCALTSSGGWYALSGDETGDLLAKPVFRRVHALDQTYYAQRTHIIFDKKYPDNKVAMEVLTEMAIENIQKEKAGSIYNSLQHDKQSQERLLVPYLETLQNQINCGDTVVCKAFQEKLAQKNITIGFTEENYNPAPRTPQNGWNGQHDMKKFMFEINSILSSLPSSNMGFWSEVIPIQSKPGLLAVVRKNGLGLSSETDIAIVNMDPSQKVELTRDDIHQLACNFQKRVIPEYTYYNDGKDKQYNWHTNNPDFNMAYHTVMSCIEAKRIHVDDSIKTNFPVHSANPYGMFSKKQSSKMNIAKIAKMSGEDTTLIEKGTNDTEGIIHDDEQIQPTITVENKK
ncbi:alpha-amylase [Legionella pneumophila serogroup 1]|nr:alpha-amylase [Legionella pneumophila]HAU0707764.1 alpha-amylase [Legionella pneumophila]HAU2156189.1 alpha-amylase [Legionella pneumophila]